MGLRDAMHGKPELPADPNRQHAFKAPGDHWIGHGAPPSNIASTSPSGEAVAALIAGLRSAGQSCAICRRAQDDRIHAPAED